MVEIVCMCGFKADCGKFIPPNTVQWIKGKKIVRSHNYFHCPECKVKFRGPKNTTEIGVQVLKDNVRSEIRGRGPRESELQSKVRYELYEWQRDQFRQGLRKSPPQLSLIHSLD